MAWPYSGILEFWVVILPLGFVVNHTASFTSCNAFCTIGSVDLVTQASGLRAPQPRPAAEPFPALGPMQIW